MPWTQPRLPPRPAPIPSKNDVFVAYKQATQRAGQFRTANMKRKLSSHQLKIAGRAKTTSHFPINWLPLSYNSNPRPNPNLWQYKAPTHPRLQSQSNHLNPDRQRRKSDRRPRRHLLPAKNENGHLHDAPSFSKPFCNKNRQHGHPDRHRLRRQRPHDKRDLALPHRQRQYNLHHRPNPVKARPNRTGGPARLYLQKHRYLGRRLPGLWRPGLVLPLQPTVGDLRRTQQQLKILEQQNQQRAKHLRRRPRPGSRDEL